MLFVRLHGFVLNGGEGNMLLLSSSGPRPGLASCTEPHQPSHKHDNCGHFCNPQVTLQIVARAIDPVLILPLSSLAGFLVFMLSKLVAEHGPEVAKHLSWS
jgi:hypothetical protein